MSLTRNTRNIGALRIGQCYGCYGCYAFAGLRAGSRAGEGGLAAPGTSNGSTTEHAVVSSSMARKSRSSSRAREPTTTRKSGNCRRTTCERKPA